MTVPSRHSTTPTILSVVATGSVGPDIFLALAAVRPSDDGEAFDGAYRVEEVFAARVDGYAVFGDYGVYYFAWRRYAVYSVGDAGDAAAEERLRYYGEFGSGSRILVSACAVEERSVGFGVDVGVEVGVYFRGAEDYYVEHVDCGSAVPGVGVPVCRDFYVVGVFGYGAYCVEVE